MGFLAIELRLHGTLGTKRKERESNPHAIADAGLANPWLTIRRILPDGWPSIANLEWIL